MSNRNFDSRVIIQRLQDKNYARNLYLYNTTGQRLLNNPQNSNSGALRYSTYHDGSQTMYFRGLIGGCMTADSGGVCGIPPYPGFGAGSSVAPVVSVPSAPSISSILSGNQQLTVSFLAGSDGGSPITDYQYSTNINAFSSIGSTVAPFIITGLTNGITYDVALRAVNAVGAGPITSGTGTPATTPGAPSISSILSGNQQLTVSFLAPGSDGGSAITDYQYSTNINAFSSIGATVAPFVITGLTNGVSYDIALRAVNVVGAGPNATGTGTPSTGTVVNGWATNVGRNASDSGNGITTDIFGNVYTIGTTGSGTQSTFVNSYNTVSSSVILTNTFGELIRLSGSDIFITKYNNSGVAQWATYIAGTGIDVGNAITSDTGGNIYAIGNFTTFAQINSYSTVSSGVILTNTFGNLSTNTGSNVDVCIAKYSSSGIVQWATNIGGTLGIDSGNGITTDTSGNIYTIGIYTNSSFVNSYSTVSSGIILTSTFGRLLNPTTSNSETFIAKYNSSGIVQWATSIGSTIGSSETGNKIASDIFGNIYVTGNFNGSTFVNSYDTVSSGIILTSTFGRLSTVGGTDAFIIKYNSSGIAQWATNIGGASTDGGNDIATDLNGNVYMIGAGINQIRINSYSTITAGNIITSTFAILSTFDITADPFIVKYNSSGIAQWATNISGTGANSGNNGISIDTLNNIYVTGAYIGSTFINSYSTVSNNTIITSTFGRLLGGTVNRTFTVKYNSSGVAQWATNIDGVGTLANRGNRIATDMNNNAFITGTFTTSSFINMFSTVSSGIIITSTFGRLLSQGGDDAYIVKYDTNGMM